MATFIAAGASRSTLVFGCASAWGGRPQARARFSSCIRSALSTEQSGDPTTPDYRVKFSHKANPVSPWHNIPLHAGKGLYNFVAEIPKNSSAKFEVATVRIWRDEPRTPIKQDIKKGKLRFYPYNIDWNYGLLPQTWEDPAHTNADTNASGDNDPVDVVEIGSQTAETGGVYPVKVLGVYAMIDDGELDWKVIAIRADDPKADAVNDVEDVEREFPGQLQAIYEWFRDYKIPDGKPPNAFGFDNKAQNRAYALHVIEETHTFWLNLVSGKRENTEDLSLY
ncbi:V-ATPase V0 sector subunit c'' [Prototheca wickerhamii]|uniref:inorganic diphosphatase n=1 Tax=Prototheca wickerhamii TaxID=3111 RepID=A0AAD9ILM5_PROWI|nr:V-ATPase V0 sector subunit c'' [Prototheca wickerhamii]